MVKNIAIIIVVALVAGLGVWHLLSLENAEPVEEGLSREVAIVVNGEEVARDEFEAFYTRSITQMGGDPSELDEETRQQIQDQLIEEFVSRTLLRQAVENSNVTVEEEEIVAQMNAIKDQFESKEEFEKALSAEGITEKDFQDQISEDLAMQAHLNKELNLSSIGASAEEVTAAYEKAAEQGDVPPLEEVRTQVEQSVIQEKQQELYMEYLQELREAAEIEILI